MNAANTDPAGSKQDKSERDAHENDVPTQKTSNVKLRRPKRDLNTQPLNKSAASTMTERGMIMMGEENIPANTDHEAINSADNRNACPNPEMMPNYIPRGKQLRRTINFDSSPLQNMPDPKSCENPLPQPAKCDQAYNTPQMKLRSIVLPNSVPRGRELQRTPPEPATPIQGLNCDKDGSQAAGADNFLTPAQREPLSTPCSHVISSLRRQASKPILSGGGSVQRSVSVFNTPNGTRGRMGATATPQRTKDRSLKSKIPAFGSTQSCRKSTQQDATSLKRMKKLLVTSEKENRNFMDSTIDTGAISERITGVAKNTYLSPGLDAIPMGRQLQRTPPEGTGAMEMNNENIKMHLQFSEKQEANVLEVLPQEERTRVSPSPVPDRKSKVLSPLCFNAVSAQITKSNTMALEDDCLAVQPEPSKDTKGTEDLQNKKLELEIQHLDILKRKERLAKICDAVEDDMKQLMDGYQQTIFKLEGTDASKSSVEMPPRGQFSKQASPDDVTSCKRSDDAVEGIDQQSLQDRCSREKEDVKNAGASDKILRTDQQERPIETQHNDDQTMSESYTMQTQLTALDERIKNLEQQAKETTDPERRTSKNRLLRLLQRCEQSLKRKSAIKTSQRYT